MFSYLSAFPKQQFSFWGACFPCSTCFAVCAFERSEEAAWRNLLRGGNLVFKSPDIQVGFCLGGAHFPAFWIAKLRGCG